jgi:hypothetical protein
MPDCMHALGKQCDTIKLRYDFRSAIKMPCQGDYDPALNGEVFLLRKVQVQKPDGSRMYYPSMVLLDGIENDEQLVTRAFIRKVGERSMSVVESPNGAPDKALLDAAHREGVYTKILRSQKQVEMPDCMQAIRERCDTIKVRYYSHDATKVHCHGDYDAALNGEVYLFRNVKAQKPDGSQVPYPSVSLLIDVEYDGQYATRALIRKSGEKAMSVVESPDGAPDLAMLDNAKKKGIRTDTVWSTD